MKQADKIVMAALFGWVVLAEAAVADAPENPYKSIVPRNGFGLKDPPPPAPPSPPVDTTAKTDIKFTGITKIAGIKRAHLMTPDPKNPGKFFYYDLKESRPEDPYAEDGFEVLEIDETKESVRLRNGGNELTLTFAKNGNKLPTVPGLPGGVPGGVPTPPPVSMPVPGGLQPMRTGASPPPSAGPIIVGKNATYNPANLTPPPNLQAATGLTPAAQRTYAQPNPVNTGYGTDNTGLRSIPSRNVRTAPTHTENKLSAEEQMIVMEAQRLKAEQKGIPLPPTPPP